MKAAGFQAYLKASILKASRPFSEMGFPAIRDIQIRRVRPGRSPSASLSDVSMDKLPSFMVALESADLSVIKLVGRQKTLDKLPSFMLALESADTQITELVGSGKCIELKEAKRYLDAKASIVFDVIARTRELSVTTSEAKDEKGNSQPGAEVKVEKVTDPTIPRVAVDVIDGTTLTALGLEGAMGIGAIAPGLRNFPSLRAVAVMAAEPVLNGLKIELPFEEQVPDIVRAIARSTGKAVKDLKIISNSTDTGVHNRTIVNIMRELGVQVILPEPVIIEFPCVMNCFDFGRRKADAMIGVFGLPEIVISSVQARCLSGGSKGFKFRIASNVPLKDRTMTDLNTSFSFSADETVALRQMGVDPFREYTYHDCFSDPDAAFVMGVAITDNPDIGLKGLRKKDKILTSDSLLIDPHGNIFKIIITRSLQ